MKTALITGITGMDGSHLADFLLKKNYNVYGMIRRSSNVNFSNLELIKDKIKFINLKQPNIYQCSSISFITSLPKELDFHKIIDYDVQFEKSFVEPLNFILQKINWLVDRSYGTQGTLEDFFV